MLTCNLCIEFGLVNGALGYVQNILYMSSLSPPQLPMYTTTLFDKYDGISFKKKGPKVSPIAPIVRRSRKQIPLKMAWALTIHKSKRLTLK